MTTPLEKLIENGGWRPIEEAPKDGATVLVTDGYDTGDAKYTRNNWYRNECGDDWYSTTINPTHYMPLDTPERMARVIEVLRERLDFMVGNVNTPEMAELWAKEALLKAEQIAGETPCK